MSDEEKLLDAARDKVDQPGAGGVEAREQDAADVLDVRDQHEVCDGSSSSPTSVSEGVPGSSTSEKQACIASSGVERDDAGIAAETESLLLNRDDTSSSTPHAPMGLRKSPATKSLSFRESPDAPLLGECRICHEEDSVGRLDEPCTCAGTLRYAHQECVQRWCNEKRNTVCEICHQPYKSTYTVPEASSQESTASSVLSIEIREESGPNGPARFLTLRDTVTGEETRFDLSEPDEQQDPWACCKLLLLMVFVLMFLPRALMLLVDMEDEAGDVSLAVFFRLVGIFVPMFLLVRVISLLNARRRELEASQSEAAEAAAQVAFLLHARQAQLSSRSSSGNGSRTMSSGPAPPVAQGIV